MNAAKVSNPGPRVSDVTRLCSFSSKKLPMTGFEPRSSGVRSNCSVHCATKMFSSLFILILFTSVPTLSLAGRKVFQAIFLPLYLCRDHSIYHFFEINHLPVIVFTLLLFAFQSISYLYNFTNVVATHNDLLYSTPFASLYFVLFK